MTYLIDNGINWPFPLTAFYALHESVPDYDKRMAMIGRQVRYWARVNF